MNKRHLRRISQYRVKPFAIETSAQFRHGPPPLPIKDPEMLKKETDAVLEHSAKLTNEQKAVVELMRNGPQSTGQSGHWLRFAHVRSPRFNVKNGQRFSSRERN